MNLHYALSVLLVAVASGTLLAQDELADASVFFTPIAKNMEEAVKQQIIDARTLPEVYETNLFSLNQTTVLRTGREVQATRTVGRNLKLNPSMDLSEEAIRILVREACMRVPYSGWRENAELLSERVSELWSKFSETKTKSSSKLARPILTELYEFNVHMLHDSKSGEPPELTLSNLTNGYQSIYDEMLTELQSKFGMFKPNAVNGNPPQPDEQENSAWFAAQLANPLIHKSVIEIPTNRWPIAVHIRLARSSGEWSAIIGERSIQAPERIELTRAVTKVYRKVLTGNGAPLTPDLPVVPTADLEQPMIHNGVQLLATRKSADGMDRVEIRFRLRPTDEQSEIK